MPPDSPSQKDDRHPRGRHPWHQAARLAGVYLAASVLWVLGSDRFLRLFVGDPDTLTSLQSVKGLVFVAGTTTFLFVAVGRQLARRQGAEGCLRLALGRERELTRRLRDLDRMKNDLLIGVSHELRTPLTSVVGFARTLRHRDEQLTAEARTSFLDVVLRNSERLERQVERLLETKRLSETIDRPAYEPTDLAEVAHRVAGWMETASHPVSVEDHSVVVRADPVLVGRVLENLVHNVIRHTPEGTAARIRFVERPQEVEIHVDDGGPGIPEDLRRLVLRAFEKGDGHEHAPGLGLGLFLVDRYVRQHGGSVQIEDAPAGGTRVRVVLPREPSLGPRLRHRPEPPPSRERGERGPRVEHLARIAGLRPASRLTSEATTRRRRELAGILAAALVALPATVAVSLVRPDLTWVPTPLPALGIGLAALGLALAAYVIEKERAVRRLEGALAEEQTLRLSLEAQLRRRLGREAEEGAVASTTAFRRVVDEARRLLDADHASILAVRGSDLVVAAESGRTRDLVGEYGSFERGIAGYIARTGRPLLLRDDVDVIEVAANLGQPLTRDGPPPRSALCAPIRSGAEVVAVLNVNVLDGDRRFDGEELRLLTLFAEEAEGLLPTDVLAEDAVAEA